MSGVNMMVPLEIGLIDEGRFVENVNKALRQVQEDLIQHVKEYKHKAKKAKASIKIEIAVVCMEPEQQSYGCAAGIKIVLPSPPPAVTMLMGGESQMGENCLLCRKSGSTDDHPRQMKLTTQDGRPIDAGTGEVAAGKN